MNLSFGTYVTRAVRLGLSISFSDCAGMNLMREGFYDRYHST